MNTVPRVLAFAGSARRESLNKKLIPIAAAGARRAGAEVTIVDLRDYPLPIYDGDLEAAGFPENAARLQELFSTHDALLIASPEYNSSIPPLLKNVIDWVSRPNGGRPGLAAYRDKVAALMSASPGRLGGLRGLGELRRILGNIGVLVIPQQVGVPQAHGVFDATGQLTDPDVHMKVEDLGEALSGYVAKLSADVEPVGAA